jgi:8-oxo-dGTP pyrophosphatase MutT (NUDIX family)
MSDRNWIEQSGVIPARRSDTGVEILLITSSTTRRWGIPKGYLEPGMTPIESAINEAFEEAGVRGIIVGEALGYFFVEKSGHNFRIEVFLLEVAEIFEHWEEEDFRDRQWYSPTDALDRIESNELKRLVEDAVERLSGL